MSPDQFAAAARAFCRRRPFRPFLIEFVSGERMLIRHPELVRDAGEIYISRTPDGGYIAFSPESVARLLDQPTSASE